jgi:hypothetical protein
MKNIFYLFVIISALSFTYSCDNKGNGENDGKDSLALASKVTTVDSFLAAPEKWAFNSITITGTVSHVCRHSGKKLFLLGTDANSTVKVNAGAEVSGFDVALEGSDVEITGNVVEDSRIDEKYLNDWENEIKTAVDDGSIKVCTADGKALTGQGKKTDVKADSTAVADPYADLKVMRKKLAESGKTYIAVYSIDCLTLKEIKK